MIVWTPALLDQFHVCAGHEAVGFGHEAGSGISMTYIQIWKIMFPYSGKCGLCNDHFNFLLHFNEPTWLAGKLGYGG